MGITNRIYSHAPIALQNLLLSSYGAYLGWLRYGVDYRKALTRLRSLENLPREKWKVVQDDELQKLITHAIEKCSYYSENFHGLKTQIQAIRTDNLHQHFPLLRKDTVRSQAESFYAREKQKRHTSINTSGSTGSPLSVLTTKTSISTNYAFFENFLNSHGVSHRDKSATFAGRMIIPPNQINPPYWRHNTAQNTWLLSSYHLSEESCGAYIAFLSDLKPTFIDSYPSAIATLARHINKHQISHKIRPRVIVTSSESLSTEARNEIEEAFSCKVADQYGNAEMAGFIAQCPQGSYHANPFYGLIEVVDNEGAPLPYGATGNLALTGFINPSMPLIRYVIGDSAALTEFSCACGSSFPVVSELLGRTDDLIVLADGRKIGRMDPLFKGLHGITEAQIIQKAISSIEAHVVYSPECVNKQEVGVLLAAAIKDRLNADIEIEVLEVPSIPKGANGKFKSVISLVQR